MDKKNKRFVFRAKYKPLVFFIHATTKSPVSGRKMYLEGCEGPAPTYFLTIFPDSIPFSVFTCQK